MIRNLCLLLLTTHCLSGLIAVNAASDDELEKKESANEEAHSSIDPESKQEDQQKAASPHPEGSTSAQKRQPKPLKAANYEYIDAFTTSSSSAEGDDGNASDEDYLAPEAEADSSAESLVKSSSSSGTDSDKSPNDEDLDELFKNNVALTKSRKSSLAVGPSKGPNRSGKKPNQPRDKTMITLSSSSSDSDQQQKGKAIIQSKKGLAHKASIQQQKQGPKVILPKATSQRKDKSVAARSPSGEKVGSSKSSKDKMTAPQTKAPGKKSTNSAEIGNSSRKGKGQVKSLSDAEIDEFVAQLKAKHNSKVISKKNKQSSSDEDNKSKNEMKRKKKQSSSDEYNTSKDDTDLSDNSLDFNLSDDSLNVSSPEEKETPKKGKRTTKPQNKKQSAKKAESKSDKAGGTKATPKKKQKKLR